MRGGTLDKVDFLTRLRWVEGQVRGVQRLIDEEADRIDDLIQIASVDADARDHRPCRRARVAPMIEASS